MLLWRYKCPQCGKPWGKDNINSQHKCGYDLRILGCPQCMDIIDTERLLTKKRLVYINKTGKVDYGCDCQCSYIQLDMPAKEYSHLYYSALRSLPENIPFSYKDFCRNVCLLPLRKYMYDNFFDHSKLNMDHWNVIRFFAFLNPNSLEGKQYFLKEYGETYDELYRKTHDSRELQKLCKIAARKQEEFEQRRIERQEALHPTPKCPICGSTNLTKISVVTTAAKIYAFGIYGAGDVGKTYRCNNCGSKF